MTHLVYRLSYLRQSFSSPVLHFNQSSHYFLFFCSKNHSPERKDENRSRIQARSLPVIFRISFYPGCDPHLSKFLALEFRYNWGKNDFTIVIQRGLVFFFSSYWKLDNFSMESVSSKHLLMLSLFVISLSAILPVSNFIFHIIVISGLVCIFCYIRSL